MQLEDRSKQRGVSAHGADHASNQAPSDVAALPFAPLRFVDVHRGFGLPIGPYPDDQLDPGLSGCLLRIPTVLPPSVYRTDSLDAIETWPDRHDDGRTPASPAGAWCIGRNYRRRQRYLARSSRTHDVTVPRISFVGTAL